MSLSANGKAAPSFQRGLVKAQSFVYLDVQGVQASNGMSRDWKKKPKKGGEVESDVSGYAHDSRGKPAHSKCSGKSEMGVPRRQGK